MKSSFVRQAAVLALLAFLPAIGEAIYFRDKAPWQARVAASQIVDVDLARSWGANVLWVDARPDDQFEAGHVPDAILLNEDRWNELLPQFLAHWSPDKKVVVYCSTKSCNLASDVARRLREEAQLKDVFVLSGGWEQWLKTKK
ncbi:MAG: rhodanese-like domain-containing protein [Spartobacteria bacterium]